MNNADIRSYQVGRDNFTGWMTPGGGRGVGVRGDKADDNHAR
jgi:hypothetical protein